MKRIMCLLIMLCLIISLDVSADDSDNKYEMWAQSPYLTCGYTTDDIRIYKSIDQNEITMYPLNELGDKYYLLICQAKTTKGGYKENKDTSRNFLYIVYLTDDGFIILSKANDSNEYYWDSGFEIDDISDRVDVQHYKNSGSEIPYCIIRPLGKYTNSNYTEYDDYWVITYNGNIYKQAEKVERSTEGYLFLKDGILYRGQDRYESGSKYPCYYMPGSGELASSVREVSFKEGSIVFGTQVLTELSTMTEKNGYRMYNDGLSTNIPSLRPILIPGSGNKYVSVSYLQRLNESGSEKSYCHIDTYSLDGTHLRKIKSAEFEYGYKGTSPKTVKTFNGINDDYYRSNGLPVPKILLNNDIAITDSGDIFEINLDKEIYGYGWYLGTYNGRLAVVRNQTAGENIYKYNEKNGYNCYHQVVNELSFDMVGNTMLSKDIEFPVGTVTGLDGYFNSKNKWTSPDFTVLSSGDTKTWFKRNLTNKFSDGRYVEARWVNIGSGIYELWYEIYKSSGVLISTGPTGKSAYFGSSLSTYSLVCYAINNTKFISTIGDIKSDFAEEYYRVSVVSENKDGEISGNANIGEKSITPPDTSDTEIVQPKIDFGKEELPIGYNIKDNVIDSGKLESELREQVNAIRLNDIVILAENKYQSGSQNIGVTLGTFSKYEYSMGSTYIRLYTNGQYFRWYCNSPQKLMPGTYTKEFQVGDKTLYVTFKVIKPPTNDGSTTVVF